MLTIDYRCYIIPKAETQILIIPLQNEKNTNISAIINFNKIFRQPLYGVYGIHTQ